MTPFEDLEVKEAESPSFFAPTYDYKLLFVTHIYSPGLKYFTKCKEEATHYSLVPAYKGDNPQWIKAFQIINGESSIKELYEKFRKIESEYGLPESKVSILNINELSAINCIPYQALQFEGFEGPVSREIFVILLKEAVGTHCFADYADSKGIVKKIFNNLAFFLPKVDEYVAKIPINNCHNALYTGLYSDLGIKAWSNRGFLDKVLEENP